MTPVHYMFEVANGSTDFILNPDTPIHYNNIIIYCNGVKLNSDWDYYRDHGLIVIRDLHLPTLSRLWRRIKTLFKRQPPALGDSDTYVVIVGIEDNYKEFPRDLFM